MAASLRRPPHQIGLAARVALKFLGFAVDKDGIISKLEAPIWPKAMRYAASFHDTLEDLWT